MVGIRSRLTTKVNSSSISSNGVDSPPLACTVLHQGRQVMLQYTSCVNCSSMWTIYFCRDGIKRTTLTTNWGSIYV